MTMRKLIVGSRGSKLALEATPFSHLRTTRDAVEVVTRRAPRILDMALIHHRLARLEAKLEELSSYE